MRDQGQMGEKMMKKAVQYVVLFMSGLLLLGGCGANQKSNTDNQEQFSQVETTQEIRTTQDNQGAPDTTEKVPETDVSDIVSDETSGSSVPTIMITQEKKEWYTDDGEVLLLEAEADRVEITGDGFGALQGVISEQWKGLDDDYGEILEMAREHYDSLEGDDRTYFMNYTVSEGVAVSRIDDRVVSFCESYYEYTGGAHGYYGFDGAAFDVKSGKKLQLEDILSDAEGFYDKAVSYIIEELEKNYGEGLFPEYKEIVETDTFGGTPVCWYLDDTGIVIEYGLYTVAPYVTGAPDVTLPYDEFAAYIKEEYTAPCSSGIVRVSANEDFSGLIGEQGRLVLEVAQDEYEQDNVTVVSENASEKVGTFVRVVDAYVIKREDGRSFLIFVCDYASDDFVTYVYEVTDGRVRECDKLDGAAWSGTCLGTDRIGLSIHLDVLGSYNGKMIYLLTEDGKLSQTEEIFAIDAFPFQVMTVVRELPVTMEGEETTLPTGSKIKITGTDNAGTAYFQLQSDTGETGMIKYVRDDAQWQLMIDGVSENEYFEMVYYAG